MVFSETRPVLASAPKSLESAVISLEGSLEGFARQGSNRFRSFRELYRRQDC